MSPPKYRLTESAPICVLAPISILKHLSCGANDKIDRITGAQSFCFDFSILLKDFDGFILGVVRYFMVEAYFDRVMG